MPGLTIRSALAMMAIAAAALGSAATATAAPSGPCQDVPYVGVCQPLHDNQRPSSQQGLAGTVLPGAGIHPDTVG